MASPSKSPKPAKTPRPRKAKRKSPEYDLQCLCLDWFVEAHPEGVLMSVPNEAAYARKELYKKSGMLSGAPDLVVALKQRVVFLEMKSPTGRCSAEQKAVHKKLEALGHEIYVVRSLAAFRAAIQNKATTPA